VRPDRPLQLPIAAAGDPAHHLHIDVRALRVPRHHRPQQGKLLCVAVLEGRARWRAPESVCQCGVCRYGGELTDAPGEEKRGLS
jgi:hypothetical protein